MLFGKRIILITILITPLGEWLMAQNHQHEIPHPLASSSSPYLRQHADNPVIWYEWNEKTLAKAQQENKPLLISIGYMACHWCHVMEEETFMDSTVANIMNANFIPVKVDREERPDIDKMYTQASIALTGNAGWPLNVIALPNGKPFYAATYMPKEQWLEVLQRISKLYSTSPDRLVQNANQLTAKINNTTKTSEPASKANYKTLYSDIWNGWRAHYDQYSGGFRQLNKFPLPANWQLLLQYYYYTGNEKVLKAVTKTLDELAKGGIHDQIGGGFSRYATDGSWKVPHFEKMLYDNAQLVSLYSKAYQVTKNDDYKQVAYKTLEFIERTMTHPEGVFYSAVDAGGMGREGKYYTWTKAEIDGLLPDDISRLINEYYQVTASGNWKDGRNILYTRETGASFAEKHDLSIEEWNNILGIAHQKLRQHRSSREHPRIDEKVITAWNSLMIQAYIDAYLAFQNSAYLKTAIDCARFMENNMVREDGGLWRIYNHGKPSINAFLIDYACLTNAYIELYEATFDIYWLNRAKELTDFTIEKFYDQEDLLFHFTAKKEDELPLKNTETEDGVMPSSNAVMAHVLHKLSVYFNDHTYQQKSERMLNKVLQDAGTGRPGHAVWLQLVGNITFDPCEIAIVGPNAANLSQNLQQHYLPNAVFMGGKEENLPLLKHKLIAEETLIYVCRNRACKLPVSEVSKAIELIQSLP